MPGCAKPSRTISFNPYNRTSKVLVVPSFSEVKNHVIFKDMESEFSDIAGFLKLRCV